MEEMPRQGSSGTVPDRMAGSFEAINLRKGRKTMKNTTHSPKQAALPTATQIGQAVTQVQALQALPVLISVSAADKAHIARVRRGGEVLIALMAHTAQAYPGLVLPGTDPQAMLDAIALAVQIGALQAAVDVLQTKVDDTLLQTLGVAWHQATDVYAMLSRATQSDPDVKTAVAQMAAFLAKNAPKKADKGAKAPGAGAKAPASSQASAGGTSGPAAGGGAGDQVPVYTPSGPARTTAATNKSS